MVVVVVVVVVMMMVREMSKRCYLMDEYACVCKIPYISMTGLAKHTRGGLLTMMGCSTAELALRNFSIFCVCTSANDLRADVTGDADICAANTLTG
jgi:hypothetical protein